jgi:hypothetical protein
MWSEEMDRKIKAAAENDTHGYEDKSWKDMEVLLDKHLPQKKKRRGIIVFVLLAALGLSGYLLVSSISSSKKPVVQQNDTSIPASAASDQQKTSPARETTINKNDNTVTKKPVTADNNTQPVDQIINIDQTANGLKPSATNNNSISPVTKSTDSKIKIDKNKVIDKSITLVPTSIQPANRNNTKQPRQIIQKNNTVTDKKNSSLNIIAESITTISADQNKEQKITTVNTESITKNDPATVPSQPATAVEKKNEKEEPIAAATNDPAKKEQKAKQKSSKFFFSFSFGPDLSSAGIDNPGRVKSQFGVGVGYAISDKFTVRTGFYAGRKIYSADSSSYKIATGGPYSTWPKPYKIDANCFVYEIPVNVVYNFAQSKKHSWFVSAGLSSYLMKEEKYVYNYKSLSGQQYSSRKEYKNDNSHIFSILGLSGGYQYHVSKRFSLLAEPYIKMPLSGVGEGKVKLNSAGVLFTATLKPFGK